MSDAPQVLALPMAVVDIQLNGQRLVLADIQTAKALRDQIDAALAALDNARPSEADPESR